MTSLDELWRRTVERGILLRAEGDQIRFRAPPGALDPELLRAIRVNKPQLIAYLRAKDQDLLIPLRRGCGQGQAVGFAPTVVGWGLLYASLTRFLPQGFDAYSCRLPGSKPGESPLPTLEEMAGHCARLFSLGDAYDSWTLVGWSFGGVLALATARQMHAEGVKVARVVLIDSYMPLPGRAGAVLKESALLEGFVRVLCGKAQAEDFAERSRAAPDGEVVSYICARHRGLSEGEIASMLHLYRANMRALHSYDEGPGFGDIVEIRAQESLGWLSQDPPKVRPLRGGEATVVTLPGDHFSLLAGNSVDLVGEILHDKLATPSVRRSLTQSRPSKRID